MLDLIPGENFSPSSSVKRMWLFTPKQKKSEANITVNGFFSTHRYDRCIQAVLAIFLIEAVTLYLLYDYSNGNTFIFGIVAFAAIVDFILMLISHRNQDLICLLENKLAVESDPVEQQGLLQGKIDGNSEDEKIGMNKLRRNKIFFNFVIYLLAVVKCLAFYNFFRTVPDAPLGTFIGVCLLYFIEAYLHTKFTGYLWYTEQFKSKLKKEHNAYVSSEAGRKMYSYNEHPNGWLITSEFPLKETRQGKQTITKEPNQQNQFRLTAYGILTDNELLLLAHDQDTKEQRSKVLIEGIKYQISLHNL
jgi:hypothetical protein